MKIDAHTVARFEAKVDRSGECWTWTASRDARGYGHFGVGSRTDGSRRIVKAHRVAYELAFGPIPEGNDYHGACVLHRCDNPRCVNPAHLWLGTNTENTADRNTKRRQSRGEGRPGAKLTDETAAALKSDLAAGMPQRRAAAKYGVGASTVWNVKAGRTWKHVGRDWMRRGGRQ